MRTFIIALCMVLAAVSPGFQSAAQTGCKPNPQSKDYTGVSRLEDFTTDHVWNELFTLPSGVSAYDRTDLAEKGLTFTCDNTNNDLVVVENCGFDPNLTYRNNQLRYRVLANKTGEAILSVHCTYEGVTTTKEIKITVTEAGDNPFIPREPSLSNMTGLRSSKQVKRTAGVSNFFTLPKGWNDCKKWADWGITWGFTVSNPEIISNGWNATECEKSRRSTHRCTPCAATMMRQRCFVLIPLPRLQFLPTTEKCRMRNIL